MALDEWTEDDTNDEDDNDDGTARAGVVALDRAGSIIMFWLKPRADDEDDESDACNENGCGDDLTLRTGVSDDDDTDNDADDDDDEATAWRTE